MTTSDGKILMWLQSAFVQRSSYTSCCLWTGNVWFEMYFQDLHRFPLLVLLSIQIQVYNTIHLNLSIHRLVWQATLCWDYKITASGCTTSRGNYSFHTNAMTPKNCVCCWHDWVIQGYSTRAGLWDCLQLWIYARLTLLGCGERRSRCTGLIELTRLLSAVVQPLSKNVCFHVDIGISLYISYTGAWKWV